MDPRELQRIQSLPGNERCIDCTQTNPQWASVPLGVLLCLDCSGPHRGLGVHLDFVRSLAMDSWTEEQLDLLRAGGNANFAAYLKEVGVAHANGADRPDAGSIRATYANPLVQRYKGVLAAAAKGGAPPSSSSSHSRPEDAAREAEELAEVERSVRADPPLAWTEAYPPLARFISGQILRRFKAAALAVVLASLAATTAVCVFSAKPPRALNSSLFTALKLMGLALPSGYVAIVSLASKMCANNRLSPFKSAQNLLLERIAQKRAVRKEGYDIFLPPPLGDDSKGKKRKTMGLLFYPGALVNHTAYAPIMAKLSDLGIMVCVVSLEPLRFEVEPVAGELQKSALKIMYEALAVTGRDVSEWAVGGHSAGGDVARTLASVMRPGVSKLVLWAAYGNERGISLRNTAVEVLVLTGTKDGFYNSLSASAVRKWKDALPPEEGRGGSEKGCTTYSTIEGANHAGFGHYGPQTFPFFQDGQRTITLDEQQLVVVETTANFLLKE